jgi:DNA-binding response OmpR family regulator
MRLLVVEDEVRMAQALKLGLEAEGFEIDLAHDGLTGFSMAMEGRYDALVLDILLPGMNGYKVCAEMRAAGNWTPILMLTAKSGEYDEAEALDTGADDFLSKPFSYVVLIARLRALVRRGSGARPVPCQVGDLRLDPATRTCDRGGVAIHLTPREVDLLEALMTRAGEVVSKQELLDRVWGNDSGVDPNVVEVYLGYLRRKIDRPFDRETLQTVRGVGYLLAED